MRWTPLVLLAIGTLAWSACADAYGASDRTDVAADGGRATGERGGSCYPNATCNAPLTCIDSLCVLVDDGGAKPAVSYEAYDDTMCTRALRCSPDFYADKPACLAAYRAGRTIPTPKGVIAPTQTQLDACTAKYAALTTCDGAFYFAECFWRGALPNRAPCTAGNECSGGACNRATSADPCGRCASAVPEGGSCEFATKDCDAGLYCTDGVCRQPLARDADCSLHPYLCGADLGCVGGKCTTAVGLGADCPNYVGCAKPLDCNSTTKKCVKPTYKNIGEDCDWLSAVYCRASRCDDDNKCVAFLGAGAACVDNFECEGALYCEGGKCQEAAGSCR